TNDVISLTTGHGCYAALLTDKGKIQTDIRIAARAEDLLFELPYERARWLAAEIDRYVFREKVTLTAHDTDRAALLLAGPATETPLATLGLGLPTALWGWGPGRIGDVSCDVTRADWFGDTPAVTIWVATDDLAQALDQV